MLPGYLKRDKDSVLFNGEGEFVFYIPEYYFESKYAVTEGEYVSVLGILQYNVYDEKGKSITGFRDFKFPSVFLTKPSDIDKVKDAAVGKETLDVRVLRYRKGDQIIVSTKVAQLTDNIDLFFKLFNSGKQPTTIPYNEVQNYYLEAASLNDMNYGVTTQLIGIVISELYRDQKDLSIPFRISKNFDNKSYRPLRIIDVPRYVGTYSAFMSQTFDDALVSSMINKKDTYSPLSKLLTD